jgi:hypothetical protein
MPNVSFPDDISDAQLSALGITKTDITETINYNCYCVIGSSSPTYVPTTETHTLGTNEVLMSTDQTVSNSVAKEDGTWITPPSEYTVYTCTDGKLAIDVNSTYAAVEKSFEPRLTNNIAASMNAALSKANGTITEAQYEANFSDLATKNATIFTEMISAKEAAVNG